MLIEYAYRIHFFHNAHFNIKFHIKSHSYAEILVVFCSIQAEIRNSLVLVLKLPLF